MPFWNEIGSVAAQAQTGTGTITPLTVDDPIQYVPPPAETLTYDAEPERPAGAETDGALAPPRRGEGAGKRRPDHCNLKTDGRWTYTWDAADRLISMQSIAFTQTVSPPLAAVTVPAKLIEFTYDGLSRRIRKKVTEGASTIAVWKAYIYDGWSRWLWDSRRQTQRSGARRGIAA
jgi:YD repeat-containing protein